MTGWLKEKDTKDHLESFWDEEMGEMEEHSNSD